jgi:hypothetical protein
VFEKVQNPVHWKNPIRAFIAPNLKSIVMEAIIFYTATVPTFTPQADGTLLVEAIGYRRGPAGDH